MTNSEGSPAATPAAAALDARALPPGLRRIEEQHGFQQRSWAVERIGWLGMALVILAGLFGLFGGAGWLLEGEAATPDGALRLRHDRTQRLGSPVSFRVELRAPPDGRATLRLGPEFLEHWKLESIAPQPETASTGPDGVRLTFQAAPGAAVLPILLHGQAAGSFGLVRAELAAGEGPALPLSVLVWP